jgi:hypothetical protein
MAVGRGRMIEAFEPAVDEGEDGRESEAMVERGKGLQMEACAAEEGFGGVDAALLDVDEGAGELDQALVERGVGAASSGEPDGFEGVVRFVEASVVEEIEESGVTHLAGVGWRLLRMIWLVVLVRPAHGWPMYRVLCAAQIRIGPVQRLARAGWGGRQAGWIVSRLDDRAISHLDNRGVVGHS